MKVGRRTPAADGFQVSIIPDGHTTVLRDSRLANVEESLPLVHQLPRP